MKNSEKPFAFNLLTGNKELFFDVFLPSVENIACCKGIALFSVSFQTSSYTYGQAKQAVLALKDFGFDVRHRMFNRSDYTDSRNDRAIKMAAMRNTVTKLSPASIGYLMIDDDMVFRKAPGKSRMSKKSSGEKYYDMFGYMSKNPFCGVIESKGFLGGAQQGHRIKCVKRFGHPATNKGLLIRNTFRGRMIPDSIANKYFGPTSDWICSLLRIEMGYYYARQMNNPTLHRERNQSKVNKSSSAGIWVTRDIFENNYLKFAKKRYGKQIEYQTVIRPGQSPTKAGMYYKVIDELHRTNREKLERVK